MSKFTEAEKIDFAKSLNMSVEELDDILKAGEADEELEEKEIKPEGEDSEDSSDEEQEKSKTKDLKKSILSDIHEKFQELKALSKPEPIEKSDENDLIKSFGELKNDLMKSIESYNEQMTIIKSENDDLKKSIGEMKEVIEKIASNSQGTKGMRFNVGNVLEKSMDVEEKDGKAYFSSKDKQGILKAMDTLFNSAQTEDLKKSIGDDMIQLESTGQMTQGALARLNANGIYVKEQM
jgi:hypothetical protein